MWLVSTILVLVAVQTAGTEWLMVFFHMIDHGCLGHDIIGCESHFTVQSSS
jgi:hypothetical protein